MDGTKVARHSDVELAASVNLAAAVLEKGPIADQVHAAWQLLVAKNDFHHGAIYNSFLRDPGRIPDWLELTDSEIKTRREAAWAKRLAKYAEMQAALRQSLTPRPHRFEVVPAPQAK